MDKVKKRIMDDCKSRKPHLESDARVWWRTPPVDSETGRQPLRIVVEAEVLTLNLRSETNGEVDTLRRRIEHIAYNGHEGCLFPSVRNNVPEPYLHVIATLEAVRRGADVRGAGGKPKEVARRLLGAKQNAERPFIGFDEAFSLFDEIKADQDDTFSWVSIMVDRKAEKKRVFLRAVELYEDQGAILVTRVDGGDGRH